MAESADTIIYHGTPLSPRAALNAVLPGRASCVSFWRPDDVEAVEAVCPQVMFRQRRVFGMAGSAQARRRLVHPRGLEALLRVAGTTAVHAGPVGGHPRRARRSVPAQRQPVAGMAVRTEGLASVAYGWANRAAATAVRSVRPSLPRMGRRGQDTGLSRVSCADGGSRRRARQPLAGPAHDARNAGGLRLSVHERGQHQPRTERMAL